MTTSLIKEKLSKIVSNQLPEFIQTDYSTFVSFIEAYYRFLEQDQGAFELLQNSRKYSDIDQTVEPFVKYFLANYSQDIPDSVLINKRLLVKKIKDLYESKGSELSFKLLFRILFDEDISVKYPFENVLRASAGKWDQNFSIRVETVSGDRTALSNRLLSYSFNGIDYEIPITRIKNLTATLTEIFLDSTFTPSAFITNDNVYVYDGDNEEIFSGRVSPTTTTYTVTQSGLGFKKGQIFTINAFGGVDTLIKISNTTSSGGISELKIVNYGYGYTGFANETFITVTLSNTNSVSEVYNSFISKTQGFTDVVRVSGIDPFNPENYFLEDYTTDPINEIYAAEVIELTTTTSSSATIPFVDIRGNVPNNLAVITFNLDGLSKYPGSYTTNESFLSEAEVRLQDGLLYQPFAYQTETSLDIDSFYDIVKQLIHPAGQQLFNNRVLSNEVDLTPRRITIPASNVFFEAHNSFELSDNDDFVFFKNEVEQVNIIELNIFDITKPIDPDTVDAVEDESFVLNRLIQREQFYGYDESNPDKYFEEQYVLNLPGDLYIQTIETFIDVETVTMNDSNIIINVGFVNLFPNISANVSETSSSLIGKNINNTESILNVTQILNLAAGEQDYVDDYFEYPAYVLNNLIEITV